MSFFEVTLFINFYLLIFIFVGIGSIPDAVLAQLGDHKDIGIHSEMFANGVIDLVHKGVITNSKKPLHQGRIVSSFLIGSKELYDFVDNNPFIGEFDVNYLFYSIQ